jgi:hypothetical protein
MTQPDRVEGRDTISDAEFKVRNPRAVRLPPQARSTKRLMTWHREDILSLTDEEIIAKAIEDGENPAEIAARMRRLFEAALAMYWPQLDPPTSK